MALSTPASVLQLSGSATREIDYRKLPHFHIRQESGDFLLLGKLGTTVHKHPSFQENNRSHDHLFLEGSIATHRHLFLEAFLISSIGTPISTLNALCLSMFIL